MKNYINTPIFILIHVVFFLARIFRKKYIKNGVWHVMECAKAEIQMAATQGEKGIDPPQTKNNKKLGGG